jgi:hypothetical protein
MQQASSTRAVRRPEKFAICGAVGDDPAPMGTSPASAFIGSAVMVALWALSGRPNQDRFEISGRLSCFTVTRNVRSPTPASKSPQRLLRWSPRVAKIKMLSLWPLISYRPVANAFAMVGHGR